MAGRTQGERIDELVRLTAAQAERVDSLKDTIDQLEAEQSQFRTDLAALTTRVAILEHQTGDLRKLKEEWGRRLWTILGPILGAIVGGIIGYFLKH